LFKGRKDKGKRFRVPNVVVKDAHRVWGLRGVNYKQLPRERIVGRRKIGEGLFKKQRKAPRKYEGTGRNDATRGGSLGKEKQSINDKGHRLQ